MTTPPSSTEVVAAMVGIRLRGPGASNDVWPHTITHEVIAVAHSHGVVGLMWDAVESGLLNGSPDVVDAARERFHRDLHASLFAEETAVLTVEALRAAGVDTRALKGLALAHLDHSDPSARMFADADVMIRRADHDIALTALHAAGFKRPRPPVRNGWERRFAKAVLMRAPNGGELDLHMAITPGYFGARLNHERMWQVAPDELSIGGVAMHALDRPDRLLHACCHSALGGLSGFRAQHDIAHLVLMAGADWTLTVERATSDGADLVVAASTRLAWEALGLDTSHPFARWAVGHEGDDRQRRALASYNVSNRDGWLAEGRGMLDALGPIDKVRFLAGLALPSRQSRAARDRSWRDQFARARSVLRR